MSKITIGDIKRNTEIAFLRENELISVKKINTQEALNLAQKYGTWCFEKDLQPDVMQSFIQKLFNIGIIDVKTHDYIFQKEILGLDVLDN